MIETAEAEHEESRRERKRSRPNTQTKRLDGNKTGPEQQQTPQVHATSKEEVGTNTSHLVTRARHLWRLPHSTGWRAEDFFPFAGGSHHRTQWPEKPASRRKQMHERLAGRVTKQIVLFVKLVTRSRRTHQHLAARMARVQVDVRWVRRTTHKSTRTAAWRA